MAELFDTTKQNVSLHIKNILKEGELPEDSVVKEYLTTAEDGKRYQTKHYNLHMILAVGYRVRSPRGTQFHQTAAEIVVSRADPNAPNMALTNWSGSRVRKHDVIVAKNYLNADEVDTLNRLVVIFLEQAELRVPSLAEQKKFVAKVQALEKQIADAQAVIDAAPARKEAVMKKYL